jgi:hypothetical protein
VDEGIIDIRKYLSAPSKEGVRAFSVWGGEGERARFDLPVWRAVFLVDGNRGGIFHVGGSGAGAGAPFFVLDLKEDPARTSFPSPPASLLAQRDAPVFSSRPSGGILVFLGEGQGRKWFLEVVRFLPSWESGERNSSSRPVSVPASSSSGNSLERRSKPPSS